jgi:hypothetical protein
MQKATHRESMRTGQIQRDYKEPLGDLDFVILNNDDTPVFSSEDDTEGDHLRKIRSDLVRLERAGFAANLRKSFAVIRESEDMGYLLTPTDLKPRPKKVEAIQRILVPTKRL